MTITIYHSPNCGTSRNVLAMIRQSGEPVVIEYLKTPPTRERLEELIPAMGIPVRALLREKGTPYAELGLGDPKWTDDELLDFMMAHPILPLFRLPTNRGVLRFAFPSQRISQPVAVPLLGQQLESVSRQEVRWPPPFAAQPPCAGRKAAAQAR